MIVGKETITDYIPHRPPFVMVGNLASVTRERFESDFGIDGDNVLVRDGFFQETGLIEHIAQTCAASFVTELPPVGATIRTVVTPLHQLGNIYLVKGESFLDGRILLGCELKIVVSE
jgi:hypothetical protein